jgi:hypothetical protein
MWIHVGDLLIFRSVCILISQNISTVVAQTIMKK